MKNILKKIALACQTLTFAVVIALLIQPPLSFAVYNDDTATGSNNLRVLNLKILDVGIYDSGGTLRYTPGSTNAFTGNFSTSGGQQSMGAAGVALSTQNTSGLSAGDIYYAYLAGTNNAIEGSALVSTTSASGNSISVIVAPATIGLTNFVGCASAAVSTGSVVGVYSGSAWAQCLTTGTVVAGDQLATSSLSVGYLYAPTTGTNSLLASTATVGVALSVGVVAGGRIRVKLK